MGSWSPDIRGPTHGVGQTHGGLTPWWTYPEWLLHFNFLGLLDSWYVWTYPGGPTHGDGLTPWWTYPEWLLHLDLLGLLESQGDHWHQQLGARLRENN